MTALLAPIVQEACTASRAEQVQAPAARAPHAAPHARDAVLAARADVLAPRLASFRLLLTHTNTARAAAVSLTATLRTRRLR